MRTRIKLLEHADGLQWWLEWHGPRGSGNLETNGYTAFAYAARVVTGAQGPVPLEPLPGDWQTGREIRLTQRSDDLWVISEGRRYSECLDDCDVIGALAFVINKLPLPEPCFPLSDYPGHVVSNPFAYPRAGQQYLPEREGVACPDTEN